MTGKNIDLTKILNSEFFPFLVIIGFLGTALAISDPFGHILRTLGIYFNKRDLRINDSDLNDIYSDDLIDNQTTRFNRNSARGNLNEIDEHNLNERVLNKRQRKIQVERELNDLNRDLEEIQNSGSIDLIRGIEDGKDKLQTELNELNKYIDRLFTIRFYQQRNIIGKQATESQWVLFEIDKVVSILYFLIIVSIFTYTLYLNPSIITNYLEGFLKSITVNELDPTGPLNLTYKMVGALQLIFIILLFGIGISLYFSLVRLRRQIKTVSIYMLAIGREKSEFNEYIDKITQYLSTKQWEMAELWSGLLQNKLQ